MAQWDTYAETDLDVGEVNITNVQTRGGLAYMSGVNLETGDPVVKVVNIPEGGIPKAKEIGTTDIKNILSDGHESIEFHSNYNPSDVMDSLNENINVGHPVKQSMNVALVEQSGVSRKEAYQNADRYSAEEYKAKIDGVFPDGPDTNKVAQANADTGLNRIFNQEASRVEIIRDVSLLKRVMGKFGVIGGGFSALIAASSGASAAEVVAAAVPGGEAVLDISEGNKTEGILKGIEEIPVVGAVVTEIVRPLTRGLGAKNIEPGLIEEGGAFVAGYVSEALGDAADYIKKEFFSSDEVAIQQDSLLKDPALGLPSKINGAPFLDAMLDPEIRETFEGHLREMENTEALGAIAELCELETVRQEKLTEEVASLNVEKPMPQQHQPENTAKEIISVQG